ncbi:MAG TPA: hypothetical protein PKA98_10585, partial [Acidimicrobiales bacterium]|nr:hypothetical protein [Acidimicrobiales bacterium]
MGTQRFTLTPAARRAIIVAGGWSIGALLVLAIAFAFLPPGTGAHAAVATVDRARALDVLFRAGCVAPDPAVL